LRRPHGPSFRRSPPRHRRRRSRSPPRRRPPPPPGAPDIPLPSYLVPGTAAALKYLDLERKKKLVFGSKGPSTTAGSLAGLVKTPGGASAPPGRSLNLGLGSSQYSVGAGSKPAKDKAPATNKASSSGASASGGASTSDSGAGSIWCATTFSGDSDGKMAEKFKRLMGVKAPEKAAAPPDAPNLSAKQEVLFSSMERQYEVARQITHGHKGHGLGFGQ